MENKKTKIISIIAIIALVLTVITATYAYFQAQTGEGSQADVKINANTVDTLSFEAGSSLTFTADQDTFANGKASLSGTTFAKAILTANNKTNSATNNYNLYLNISDNNFTYTQDINTPELLLQITDASNNSITSIDGLTYKTVTDNKNTSISGFDITNKTGLINLFTNRAITTTSSKTEEWTIKITFVNYNKDQSANAGKSFDGQILISKDTFDNYTPNTINTLSATKSGTNLTVNLNVEQGSNEIDKYYYAIEETNGIALIDNTSKVQRLSNRLAVSNLTYVESNSSSHTFTNLSSTKDYKVSAYVIDKKKIRSNTYEYNVSSSSYVYPTISKVETNTTSNSITATVTATKGTNNISKYYYSIDNGSTFIESTSNSYTFSNLNGGSYRIMVKVIDTNKKYSNIYLENAYVEASQTLAEYVISQYNNIQGNNGIYYHNSSLANGAGDNSYRYAGANPNNYVCFGSDEEICPDDNLYRIIGVFDENVKLIKTISVRNMEWASDSQKTYLNGEYILNLGIYTKNIINTMWKIGGSSPQNIKNVVPSVVYQNEIKNPEDVSTNTLQIGLMYVSDYGFAASPSAWTTNLESYNSSLITSVNWLYLGLKEWTITKAGVNYSNVYRIDDTGTIIREYDRDNGKKGEIRPTFYLNSNIYYITGSGTYSDPIRIS